MDQENVFRRLTITVLPRSRAIVRQSVAVRILIGKSDRECLGRVVWVGVYSTPFVILTDGRVGVRELNLCQILRLGVARSIVTVCDFVEKEIAQLQM